MPKILMIYAHPDDESFGCGGTIAKYVSQGVEVVLICATKGEAGKCGEPPVCSCEELPRVRENELLAASKVLGIKKVIFLDYIDAQLFQVDEKEAVTRLVNIIDDERPDIVITFGPDGISGHRDHIIISSWATKAFFEAGFRPRKLYYNAVSPEFLAIVRKGEPDVSNPITTKINIEEFMEDKLKAIQCHRSQNMSIGKLLTIPKEKRKSMLANEGFHRAYPPVKKENIIEVDLLD